MSASVREMLTLVVIFQGLILVVLLFVRKRNRRSNVFLGAYLLVLIILISWKTYRSEATIQLLPYSFQFPYTFWFILHPLSYLYVRSLITGRFLQRRDFIHLVPFVIAVAVLSPYIFMPVDAKVQHFLSLGISVHPTFDFVFVLCIVLQGLGYAIASVILLTRHDHRVLNLFSNVESVDLRWLRVLVYYLILTHFLSLVAEFLIFYQVEKLELFYDLSFYAFVLLIYIISYRALAQPQVFYLPASNGKGSATDKGSDMKSSEKYQKSRLTDEQSRQYLEEIEQHMRVTEPFTKSDLTINDLAEDLDIPRHHISQLLNVQLNKNFYTYVNEFRVEKTKQLMTEEKFKNYSLLGIALEAGFNSKTSFNRIFKSIAGTTPSEYFRQHGQRE